MQPYQCNHIICDQDFQFSVWGLSENCCHFERKHYQLSQKWWLFHSKKLKLERWEQVKKWQKIQALFFSKCTFSSCSKGNLDLWKYAPFRRENWNSYITNDFSLYLEGRLSDKEFRGKRSWLFLIFLLEFLEIIIAVPNVLG